MKSANIKNIFVSFVVISSIASPSFATPLSQHRASITSLRAHLRGQLDAESESIKSDLLSKLKVSVNSDLSAFQGGEMQTMNEAPRLSYADGLRRFMDLTAEQIEQDEKLGKPTNFNPRWSPEESRANKEARRGAICEALVKRTDVDKLLGIFELQAISSKATQYSNINSSIKKSSMLPALNFALQSFSKNKDKTVTDLIGTAVSFDVINGQVSEIQISQNQSNFNDSNTLSLSIPMLASVLTNRDDRFVEAQNCLISYFEEQKTVLLTRKEEIKNPSFAARVQKTKDAIAKLWTIYNSPRFEAERTKTTMNWKGFYAFNLRQLSRNSDIPAAYLQKASRHQMPEAKDSQTELNEIDSRLGMLSNVLPFLKAKAEGANFANKAMAKLSKTQRSELLALMLELRGRDIPTYTDIKSLRDTYVRDNQREPTAGEIDYGFYKSIESSLTNLQMHLGVL